MKYGRLTAHDEAALPYGLDAYYRALLARLHIGDEAQMLTDLLCVLLAALEPLPDSTLRQVLNPLYRYVEDLSPLLARTLERAQPLLHSRATPGDGTGWTLYHEAFREHLRNATEIGMLGLAPGSRSHTGVPAGLSTRRGMQCGTMRVTLQRTEIGTNSASCCSQRTDKFGGPGHATAGGRIRWLHR